MSSIQAEIAAISAIYDHLLEQHDWSDPLDRIADATGGTSAMLTVMDQTEPVFNTHAMSSAFEPESFDLHVANVWPHESSVAIPAILSQPPQTLIYPHKCWPEEEYQQLHSVNWLRNELDIHHRMCMRLNKQESWFDTLIINHGSQQPNANEDNIQSLKRIAPHLAKSILVQRPFRLLEYKFKTVLNALDKLNIGVAIIDSHHRLIISNEECQRIIQQTQYLKINSQSQLTSPKTGSEFQEKLAATIRTSSGQGLEEGMMMTINDDTQHYMIEFSPFVDHQHTIHGEAPAALLFIVDVDKNYPKSMKHLAIAYNLSKAEKEISAYIAEGMSNQEIAEQRNVSPNTIKLQIKKIFEKTKCSSRVELVKLATAIAPPIKD